LVEGALGMGKRLNKFLKFNVYPLAMMLVVGFIALQFLPINIPNPLRLFGGGAISDEQAVLKRLKVATGYRVSLFAKGLGNIRLMALTPDGDILYSAPRSRLRIAYGDRDGDGRSDGTKTLKGGLRQVHGIYLDGDWLYDLSLFLQMKTVP